MKDEWEKVTCECAVCGQRAVVRVHNSNKDIREAAKNKFVSRGWKTLKDKNGPWICPKDKDFVDMFDSYKVI